MISPAVTIKGETDIKNQTKTKTRVGSVVNDKVGEMEDNKREGRSIRIKKEVV